MRIAFLILIFSIKSYCQVSTNPTSTISCRNWYSLANLSITGGVPPYSFTVQTPSCSTTFTDLSTSANKSFSLSCPGSYTFVVTDATNSVIGSATHTVFLETQMKIPTLSDFGGGNTVDTICTGTYLSLGIQDTISGNLIAFHLSHLNWSNGDTSHFITVSPTVTTTYSVTGIITGTMIAPPSVAKTCSVSGSRKVVVVQLGQSKNCLLEGLLDAQEDKLYSVSPNPTNDKIRLTGMDGLSVTKVNVFNVFGQLVFNLNELKPNQEIDFGFLPVGVYYLSAQIEKKQIECKIIRN